MGKTLTLACVLVAACQPLYPKDNTPKLKNPTVIKAKDDKDKDKDKDKPPYVETCTVDFTLPPVKKRQTPAADALVVQGDTAVATAKPAPLISPTKVNQMTLAVDHYSNALRKDPYHAGATLQLALAYDEILRKACALAMLKRLHSLTTNPVLTKDAEAKIALVEQNLHWFKGYRKEAMTAVGSPGSP